MLLKDNILTHTYNRCRSKHLIMLRDCCSPLGSSMHSTTIASVYSVVSRSATVLNVRLTSINDVDDQANSSPCSRFWRYIVPRHTRPCPKSAVPTSALNTSALNSQQHPYAQQDVVCSLLPSCVSGAVSLGWVDLRARWRRILAQLCFCWLVCGI